MLFLFNKAKIISYIVSVFTVVTLFFVANNLIADKDSMQVVANNVNENTYNIEK